MPGMAPSMADMVKRIAIDGDGFTLATNKKHKGKTALKQKSTQGTAENTGQFVAGPEYIKVQLTNVHPSMTADMIRSYIEEKDDTVVINDIQDTSSEGWETKRFLITFEKTSSEKVMQPSFWPPKIYYRQWFTARPKPGEKPSGGVFKPQA